ncbi:11124_t:CDS:10 [Ambispora leptoticha]|uniref:11124_t:CDS:1 n=1 Tax=Ambispora leptoticha TaxID=144679 RepID=A0A9N8YVE7_9GLOM|nr:11124_t:CDS:10 [Ambispora leptoticha]
MAPVHDICARIQNGFLARLKSIAVPDTKMNLAISKVLYKEGFISSVTRGDHLQPDISYTPTTPENIATRRLWLDLKYRDNKPVLTRMRVVSKGSRRLWMKLEDFVSLCGGRRARFIAPLQPGEIAIVSTNFGVIEMRDAIALRSVWRITITPEQNSETSLVLKDDDFLKNFPILSNGGVSDGQFPPELEAALEDKVQTEQYVNNLKKKMEAWKAAGLTDAMKRALELLHDGNGMPPANSGDDEDDTDASPDDEPSTPTTETQESHPPPKIAEGSISRLVNGISSLVDIESCFETLRIPELDLPITAESTIKAKLAELYKLQEDLQIHLQGGPLAEPSTLGAQRRRKVQDLLDRVMKEAALYEEFSNKAQHLSLDQILNESDGSSDEEYVDSETQDTESVGIFEDSQSDISRRSTTSTLATPMSPPSFKALDSSLARLRSASSNSITSMQSRAPSSRHSRPSTPSLLGLEDIGLSAPPEPWEAFRWIPLEAISDQLYSTNFSKNYGLPTVLAVSGVIAVGTTRGLILVYEVYEKNEKKEKREQNLKCLGTTANALEHGAVTSLCISTDHTQIVSGHAQGHIFIWDISRPHNPTRTILPISTAVAAGGRKEGHIRGSSILHVDFVGVRKNGIVSGDNHGMVFYHNLYKVMMVNASETTRILGRYPVSTSGPETPVASKPPRPSVVFGLAPLPLGQSPHGSEGFGLVAMLTPYKMTIVSTKPTIQQQYKYTKPRYLPDSTKSISGCLAWYPAVKVKLNAVESNLVDTDPLLAFSWGNHLTIIKVTVAQSETPTKRRRQDREVRLEFTKVGEWKNKNGIVALQWLSHHILLILTSTEDIIVFDPRTMEESEQNNIRRKSLVYHDRFAAPLKDMPEISNISNENKLTVDLAYYHSIRVYKGAVFLLGVRQLFIGTLLSWADRILAHFSSGDLLQAIALATSFYNGTSSQTILGLPDDEESRHAIVGEKLMELLVASLNYAFPAEPTERTFQNMIDVDELAVKCVEACLSMHKEEFLFTEVYERYSSALATSTLLEVLEPYIIGDKIRDLPPEIMKNLVSHYSEKRMLARVEECIFHINPQCLDIDQVVQLCSSKGLYDAYIYVFNRSMVDYVSPAVELLDLIRKILILEKRKRRKHRLSISVASDSNGLETEDLERMRANARKFYVYLKNILTGRTYPNGAPLNENEANEARTMLYSFVFSGRCVVWPRHGGNLVLTAEDALHGAEPTYPYLRLFLRFDTHAFLEALECAFEDSYLNGIEIITSNDEHDREEEVPGKIINRQLLVNILLEVMTSSSTEHSEFTTSDISYLYCFVARNLPKYTQFLLLPPSTIKKILVKLSMDNDPRTREERQFAVECLLSIYTPEDEEQMVVLYENAGFWRVLEHVYKADKKYDLLVTTYLKDADRKKEVFDCIRALLDPQSELTSHQRDEVSAKVMSMIDDIVDIDGERTAQLIHTYFDGDHQRVIANLESSPVRLFTYLRGLLEPQDSTSTDDNLQTVDDQINATEFKPQIGPEIHEKYIALMCKFDPTGVYHYLQTHQDNTYILDDVLPICETAGIVDSVVWLLERKGDALGALDRVLKIVQEKKDDILQLIEDKKNSKNDRWTVQEKTKVDQSLMKLKGVLKIGIMLCENSCRRATLASCVGESSSSPIIPLPNRANESETELLWFKLLDAFLDATKAVSSNLSTQFPPLLPERIMANGQVSSFGMPRLPVPTHIANHLMTTFKSYVQSIMRSLLLSTSKDVSLPRLLLRFIQSQSKRNSTVADFREIFVGMIDTYKYEGQLLAMTNRLFEKDLFWGVAGVVRQRGKGWRPRRGTCEVCGGQFWGTDLTPLTLRTTSGWGSAEKKMPHSSHISTNATIADLIPNLEAAAAEDDSERSEISNEASTTKMTTTEETIAVNTTAVTQENDLLLFRCGHGYHRRCLETEYTNGDTENEPPETKCTVCQTEKRGEIRTRIQDFSKHGTIDRFIGSSKGKEKNVSLS